MNAEEIKLVINPIMETGDIKTAVNQIQGFFNKMNLSKGMKGDMEGIFRELIDEAETFEKKSKEAFKTSGDVKSFENSGKKIVSLFEKISQTMNKLGGEDLSKLFTIDDSRIASMTQEITKLQQKINSLSANEIKNVSTAIQQMNTVSKSGGIDRFFTAFKAGDMSAAESALKGLIQNVQAFSGSTTETKAAVDLMLSSFESGRIDEVKSSFGLLEGALGESTGTIKTYVSALGILINNFATLSGNGDIAQARQDIQTLEQNIETLSSENVRTLATNFNAAAPAIEKCEQNTRDFTRSMADGAARSQDLGREIDELKNRATYFLSLENSVDLFRQGIRKAIETVKELDAAMTETAVVTDFNIGDMWDKLPEYTQMANELGVATQGVYEASTLYYQQGLQTEEVMALTAETLKMARIAGLECADATNLMTAALRGFNMEINETSAQRVNDVYSELAAITAADTNEIATAMTKTASIAASANMELETTAALLAQMIETTREPAETAGTAMKTIVARFTEMKKATSDIVSVDGEEVSVNKADTALASVGVSLKNAKGEFRELDDVLLELASKWNSLDIMSQRYIATTAAGSRQQSRFIAMMQNYERTMELVNAAYSSAGASSSQFEKTQDSLESKLARLENAWNTFLMGIADDTIIKTFVDALTGLINGFNTLTSNLGGVAGSVVRLGAVFAGLRLAKLGIEKIATHFINLKTSIAGASGEVMKMSALGKLSTRFTNMGSGKGFVLTPKVNSAQVDGWFVKFKKDLALLSVTMNGAINTDGVVLGFEKVNGAMAVTGATATVTGETIEMSLSEVGTKALLASEAIEEIGEDGVKSSMTAAAAVEVLEKQYKDLGQRIAIVQAQMAAGKMNPNVGAKYLNLLQGRQRQLGGDIDGLKRIPSDLGPDNLSWGDSITKKFDNVTTKMKDFNKVLKEGGGVKKAFSTAFKGVGTSLKGIGTAAKGAAGALGKGLLGVLKAIPGWGWAAAAVITALSVAFKALKENSALADAKRIAEQDAVALEAVTQEVESLRQETEALATAWDNMQAVEDTLAGLTKGTTEWNNQVREINSEIRELLKTYPDLYKFVNVNNDGVWLLSGTGENGQTYEEYMNERNQALDEAEMSLIYRQAIAGVSESRYEIMDEIKGKNGVPDWLVQTTKEYEDWLTSVTEVNKETIKNAEAITKITKSGTTQQKAALKYFETTEKAKQDSVLQTQTYISNWATQKGYNEDIKQALLNRFDESFYESVEAMRAERGFSGGTTGGGSGNGVIATLKGEEVEINTMQEIEDWYLENGYEYAEGKMRSRHILKNTATGEYINLNKGGNGGKDGISQIKINGEKKDVEVISNEEALDWIATSELEKDFKNNLDDFVSAMEGVGENVVDVFAGQWQDIPDEVLNALATEGSIANTSAAEGLFEDLNPNFDLTLNELTGEAGNAIKTRLETLSGMTMEQIKSTYGDTATLQQVAQGIVADVAWDNQQTANIQKATLIEKSLADYTPSGMTSEQFALEYWATDTIFRDFGLDNSTIKTPEGHIEAGQASFDYIYDNANLGAFEDIIRMYDEVSGWSNKQEWVDDVNSLVAAMPEAVKKQYNLKEVTLEDFDDFMNSIISIKEDLEWALSFSNEQAGFLLSQRTQMYTGLGENLGRTIYQSMKDAYDSADDSGKKIIENVYGSMDYTSAIKSYAVLQEHIKAGGEEAQLAKGLIDSLGDSFLSAENQFKEAYLAEDFIEARAELEALYKTEGKITFDNIKEAAEKSSSLNLMLENGVVSASGFAKAMELLSEGTHTYTDLTNELVQALTLATGLMEVMDSAHEYVTNQDFGKNYTEIGLAYKDAAEAMQGFAEGGAWGNPQMEAYASFILGEDRWIQAVIDHGGNLKEAYQSLSGEIEKYQGTLLASWEAFEKIDSDMEGMFSVSGGKMVYDFLGDDNIADIKSTADLVEQIQEATGKTKEEVQAMVADAANYSPEMASALNILDKIAAINKLIKKTGDDNWFISKRDADALGINQTWLDKFAKTTDGKTMTIGNPDTVTNLFPTDELTKANLSNWVTESTETIKPELQEAFDQAVSEGLANGMTLDAAQQQALTELTGIAENALTTDIKAGLLAGYTDPAGVYAAAIAAADQANQLYVAIYSAITRAIADAYGVSQGFGVEGTTWDGTTTRTTYAIDENSRYVVDSDTGHVWKQTKNNNGDWVGVYTEGGNDYTEEYNNWQRYRTSADAAPSVTRPFEASDILTGQGYTPDQIKEFEGEYVASVEAQEETTEEIVTITDLVKKLLQGDSYKDAGYTGVNTQDGGEADKTDPSEANVSNLDKEIDAIERIQDTLDREAELIDKLPEEIAGPLKLLNMGENLVQEIKKDEVERNKLEALRGQREILEDESQYLGQYYYYDEGLEEYLYNVDAVNQLKGEERDKVEEEIQALDELNKKIHEAEDAVDGGKVQKLFHGLGKGFTEAGKSIKEIENIPDLFVKATSELYKNRDISTQVGKGITAGLMGVGLQNLMPWAKSYNTPGLIRDNQKAQEVILTIENSEIGQKLGPETKSFLGQIIGGGTTSGLLGSGIASIGEGLTGIGDLLSFDVMGQGLDMFNQMKDMASQMIQYVVQFVQTIVNWWINREDWLYNLLSAIEQEVHNFNRQEQVEERFRLYSDEGLNDLVSAWEAMRESLEKQIDLNEQLIESRQAELQFLNLTNLPFSPAFYYDYTEERVIENPWVYDIYVLLLDLGAMIPEIGGIFSSIKQLMEDNKKRMEEAVEEIEDAREEILELEKKQLELRTKYMEDEIELEELVMDTIIEKQQEEIDELTAMNDAISEGNEKLIETLNSKLDLIRQQRDNEDKEEELGEKERRLAYLRQDTSNANRAEIYDLQDELKDERRDYTDELIDQKISALEEQNEKAAEQRQKQIDLLQAQLDHTEKYGLQWTEAQTLIKNGFDSEGRLRVGTDLFDMLMSKEEFTSMGLGSTRQTQQIMDWNVTSIAAAAFREINDIWDEGFGNFAMSNDVHDQSRLHLWADREVDYRQLPSWLSFLQPAYNTIQDYLWRTGNNVEAFVETGFLSGKNSSSILGKTIVPLIQGIAGNIESMANDYKSLSIAETGDGQSHSGAIPGAFEGLNFGFGERIIKGVTDGIVNTGENIVNGFKGAIQSNSISSQNRTQNNETLTVNQYFNNETDGETAAKSFIDAATGWFNGLNGKI